VAAGKARKEALESDNYGDEGALLAGEAAEGFYVNDKEVRARIKDWGRVLTSDHNKGSWLP
jgi:hypothetical protein